MFVAGTKLNLPKLRGVRIAESDATGRSAPDKKADSPELVSDGSVEHSLKNQKA